MGGRLSGWVGLAGFVALGTVVLGAPEALAQVAATAPPAAPPPAAAPAAPAPAAPAAAAPAAPASAAPSADANGNAAAAPAAGAASASSSGNVTGYAYGSKSSVPSAAAPTHHRPPLMHHANEAVATFDGFEMLADGGSRVFVQLSKQVSIEQGNDASAPAAAKGRKGKHAKAAPGAKTLTYVIKGTEIRRHNEGEALVTVHFNTPVVRARLLPVGRDLHLVLVLRADVTPSMKVVAAKDNGAILQVDFPSGSYLPAGAAAPPPEAESGDDGASADQGTAPAPAKK